MSERYGTNERIERIEHAVHRIEVVLHRIERMVAELLAKLTGKRP